MSYVNLTDPVRARQKIVELCTPEVASNVQCRVVVDLFKLMNASDLVRRKNYRIAAETSFLQIRRWSIVTNTCRLRRTRVNRNEHVSIATNMCRS